MLECTSNWGHLEGQNFSFPLVRILKIKWNLPKFYWHQEGLLCKTLKCKVVYIFLQLKKKREKTPTSYRRVLQHELSGTFKENKKRAGKLYGYMESMHITWTFYTASLYFKFLKGRGWKLLLCRLLLQWMSPRCSAIFNICCHINQADIETATLTFVS